MDVPLLPAHLGSPLEQLEPGSLALPGVVPLHPVALGAVAVLKVLNRGALAATAGSGDTPAMDPGPLWTRRGSAG